MKERIKKICIGILVGIIAIVKIPLIIISDLLYFIVFTMCSINVKMTSVITDDESIIEGMKNGLDLSANGLRILAEGYDELKSEL